MTDRQKIIHCMHAEKFIEPFIDLVESNFDSSQHIFLIRQSEKFPTKSRANVKILSENTRPIWKMLFYIRNVSNSRKIILHGLFHKEIILMLFFQPWLLKKCYWIMWGGDLYHYQFRKRSLKSDLFEKVRAFVIRRMGHLVTYISGDYDLARQWYGATGEYHESFMYPSNLYKNYQIKPKSLQTLNILVGNSAVVTNKHLEVLKKLSIYKNKDIKIIVPLSYGSPEYAQTVIDFGRNEFGDKFIPLMEFISFEKYLKLLAEVDIAIFNHSRQQALGNTITLLGLGKKVFMRRDVVQWNLFEQIGVKIFDVLNLNLELLDAETQNRNKEVISEYFSEKKLIEQYEEIFS